MPTCIQGTTITEYRILYDSVAKMTFETTANGFLESLGLEKNLYCCPSGHFLQKKVFGQLFLPSPWARAKFRPCTRLLILITRNLRLSFSVAATGKKGGRRSITSFSRNTRIFGFMVHTSRCRSKNGVAQCGNSDFTWNWFWRKIVEEA